MKKNVLIIDDDEELCEELSDVISYEGHTVTLSHNGADGLEKISRSVFDVVFLDIRLPGMNGYEVLKALGTMQNKPKVYVLTGRPMVKELGKTKTPNNEEERALQLADGLVNKPFDIEAIISLLEK